MITQERVLRVLVEMFPNDRTRPGMVSSILDDPERFYVSACRYERGPDSKEVIAKATATTLPEAIHKLGGRLLTLAGRAGTNELDQMEMEFNEQLDSRDLKSQSDRGSEDAGELAPSKRRTPRRRKAGQD